MKKLNRNTVSALPERPIKIVQFGEGNFLRGFVDWMIDLLNERTNFNGNIQIVQPLAEGMGALINAQDGLYHLVLEGIEKGEKVQNSRLITSVSSVLNPYLHYEDFLRLGENPELQFIVSNTTEAGIVFAPEDKDYKSVPHSFPAKLTALLYHRFQFYAGDPPGTLYILPCELIEANGQLLHECVAHYADLWSLGEGFKSWLERGVLFYNTLVDRIVPGFPKTTIAAIQEHLGYKDQLVVKAEPFHLWVIEGPSQIKSELHFKQAGVNVIFTEDLTRYRTRKVRILNGAHTAMVPIGYLKGFTEVREVVEDKKLALFLDTLLFQEIIPTLDMPKAELEQYTLEVLDRFRNPFITHHLLDIALNSISKFKVRVLPSLLHYMEQNHTIPVGLASAFAYLLLFYRGEFNDTTIPLKDNENYLSFFKEAWNADSPELSIAKILSNEKLWGDNLEQKTLLSDFLKEEVKQRLSNNSS
ncbi:MAG: tagaturonate reductase [Bacteroidota bacterium]